MTPSRPRACIARGTAIVAFAIAVWAVSPAAPASAYTLKTLYTFCAQANCADGSQPQASLVQDAAGNLYGTASHGFSSADCAYAGGCGNVFELAFDGAAYKFKILYGFCSQPSCTDGAQPLGNLILDTNGNLYGTASFGGANAGTQFGGVIFKLVPNAKHTKWAYRKLYDFCAQSMCGDGQSPRGGLTYKGQANGAVYGGKSPLYGTTYLGGGGDGVTFKLVKGSTGWTETLLHVFCTTVGCQDGQYPRGITADNHTNLFGVTELGGNVGARFGCCGVLYENANASSIEQPRHFFCAQPNCADGVAPYAAPVLDANGRMLGTTNEGGANGFGAVYRFTNKSLDYTVLYSFCSQLPRCADGAAPVAGVVLDPSGDAFGTATRGGRGKNCAQIDGCGVAYRLHNGSLDVLHNFCAISSCADGGYPIGGVIIDAAGNVFGTTSAFGANGDSKTGGTVFELIP